ncbi:hypothetical protein [Anaerosalibacter bizertensis]|uniref:hypothetical protein n=1 Tax=Anaerosalibacter bizertensis TaxID=932217 RepID=UPI0012B1A615|nr:hypothetical protein [Anaerosalibacter bizertensis]
MKVEFNLKYNNGVEKLELVEDDNFICNDIPFHLSLLLEKDNKTNEDLKNVSINVIEL